MAATSVAARAKVPRYLEVARHLTEAIAGARYAIGTKLPTEAELCKHYRISRYTAREALRQLRESGLISRRRGAGTTVAAAMPHGTFRHSLGSLADITQYAEDTRLRIERQSKVEAAGAVAALLGVRRGRAWTKLEAVRERPGDPLPMCLTTVYLSPEVAGIADQLAKVTGPIHGIIEARAGVVIARVEQSIHAAALTDAQARKLHAVTGAPALRVIRRYLDGGGRIVEVSESIHPGERYAYTMTLRRS